MAKSAIKNSSRRNFLCTAPVVAAAGFALTDARLFAAPAAGQGDAAAPPAPFKLMTAEQLAGEWQGLETAPANKTVVNGGTYTIIFTVEKAKISPEFEWHAGRDHIIQILEGTTVYEIGGTPKGGHSTGPGEWLAPESVGATTYTLKKGDMLLVPRMTPHKRNTAGSVKLTLISPMGVKA